MTVTDPDHDDRTVAAGALALGLLEGPERADALRRMLADRDFAAEVERWRARTGDLFDAVPEVEPPARTWDGIAARTTTARSAPASLRWWQGGAIGGGALAAGLALALIWQRPDAATPAPSSDFAVAQLTGEIEGLRIAARYEPESATLRLRTTGMPDTPTQPELWIIPADGVPRSLGQIARSGETVIIVAEGHRSMINPAASFALSMEPRAAVPHDKPSAPMVARGAIDVI